MKIGHASYLPTAGGTLTGNLNIGAHKLKTTNLLIKEEDASSWILKNADDDAIRHLILGILEFRSFLGAGVNAASITAKSTVDNYITFKARGATALVELARLQGDAVSPYFQMTLPMVLKPSGIPGELVEGHFAYVADNDKLAFYDGANAQFIGSNLIGAFTALGFWGKDYGQSATYYLTTGPDLALVTEEIFTQHIIPVAGILKNLYVKVETAPGAGNNAVFTVRINGVDKTITCTIADTATTGNDVAHSEAIAVGDLVSIKCVTSAGAAIDDVVARVAVS